MKYIICYDIKNPKRLNLIAKELNRIGYRIQKSLFSCYLDDNEYNQLKAKVLSVIDITEDKVAFYKICEKCIHGSYSLNCNISEFFDLEYLIL